MKKIIIAIDGHSSCGKSTFAKTIAAKLGYLFIDTGSMYRATTLYALRNNLIDSKNFNEKELVKQLSQIDISFKYNQEEGKSLIYLSGNLVEEQIRGLEVSSFVSQVSSNKEVRAFLVKKQQEMGLNKGIVMDGRDIGTVVFPKAELKIFMTASVEVRAQRRYAELKARGDNVSLDQIIENIETRDFTDENRKESPLRKAPDAILLDNSYMTVGEQMEWIEKIITERTCE